MKDSSSQIERKIVENSNGINSNSERISQIAKNASSNILAQQGLVIDTSAIYVIVFTLIAWTLIIFLIVWSIRSIMSVVAAGNMNLKEDFSFVLFLEMMTVFLLTGTILVLGIAGKLTTEALAALIGGISGYVLGRMQSAKQQHNNGGSPAN